MCPVGEEKEERGAEEGQKKVGAGMTTHRGVAGVEAEGGGENFEGAGKEVGEEEKGVEGGGTAGVGGVGKWRKVGGREEGTIGTDDDGCQFFLVCLSVVLGLHRVLAFCRDQA